MPQDIQTLVNRRIEAISKIDKTFNQYLEKLKVVYTKQGDLETANGIVSLMKGEAAPVNTKLPVKNAIDQRAGAVQVDPVFRPFHTEVCLVLAPK